MCDYSTVTNSIPDILLGTTPQCRANNHIHNSMWGHTQMAIRTCGSDTKFNGLSPTHVKYIVLFEPLHLMVLPTKDASYD